MYIENVTFPSLTLCPISKDPRHYYHVSGKFVSQIEVGGSKIDCLQGFADTTKVPMDSMIFNLVHKLNHK